MPVLHLGVLDQPYNLPPPKRGTRRAGHTSTGDVATWLENKYHIMQHFYELHKRDIAHDLEKGLAASLENLLMNKFASADPFKSAEEKIETRFKKFLSGKELDALGYPGIPTKRAQEGRRLRYKNKRGAPRPSFIDTSLYETSMRAWVD